MLLKGDIQYTFISFLEWKLISLICRASHFTYSGVNSPQVELCLYYIFVSLKLF